MFSWPKSKRALAEDKIDEAYAEIAKLEKAKTAAKEVNDIGHVDGLFWRINSQKSFILECQRAIRESNNGIFYGYWPWEDRGVGW